jgi:hypothetical protein
MNRISLERLRLALRYNLAVTASPLGGWFFRQEPRLPAAALAERQP